MVEKPRFKVRAAGQQAGRAAPGYRGRRLSLRFFIRLPQVAMSHQPSAAIGAPGSSFIYSI
jgi:hypothetical protein